MKNFHFIFLLFLANQLWAVNKSDEDQTNHQFKVEYASHKTDVKSVLEILKEKFTHGKNNVFNYGVDQSTYWIKISAIKITKPSVIFVDQPRLEIESFFIDKNITRYQKLKPFQQHTDNGLKSATAFKIPPNFKPNNIILLKLKAKENFIVPIKILSETEFLQTVTTRNLLFGAFSGVMLIMCIYNLFLYIIIRDKSYFYYVFYIFFTWLTQISIQGFASKYLWQENSVIDKYSVVIFACLALVFTSLFTLSFLNIKVFSKFYYKTIKIFIFLNLINICALLIVGIHEAFIMMQLLTVVGTFLALSSAYFVYFKKHFKPAGYYLVAWSILIVGAVLFVMKDYGILPYNNFTIYLLQISSVVEVLLLSFALADRINFFKKEKELAQKRALEESIRNEQLVKQQNIYLEKNVKKRTQQLEKANNALNTTLNDLKNAQSHLVDSEKMAALGQLTAGIAHEINNPINFVTSNIKPLELDINDLKEVIHKYEQIDYSENIPEQLAKIEAFKKQIDINFVNKEISSLLEGISEGARRTAEIIKSLKSFSRIDESDMKPVDLNEGIKSTLILLKNGLPDNLQVTTIYENIPSVECLPGKINQVFMNLISNAVQAIKSKRVQNQTEYLTIKTSFEKEKVKISIKDSGIGMTEETKHRIFEPFFTTKDIGEGTGLGLSIVFGIIEKHKGYIDVISTLGEGTEFIITLNINQSNN
jgi:signal transduction histidine kinase